MVRADRLGSDHRFFNQVGVPERRAEVSGCCVLAGVTFAVSGVTIATLMIVGLTLDGAL